MTRAFARSSWFPKQPPATADTHAPAETAIALDSGVRHSGWRGPLVFAIQRGRRSSSPGTFCPIRSKQSLLRPHHLQVETGHPRDHWRDFSHEAGGRAVFLLQQHSSGGGHVFHFFAADLNCVLGLRDSSGGFLSSLPFSSCLVGACAPGAAGLEPSWGG